MGFDEVYRQSIERPERFWAEAARGIEWDVEPAQVRADGRWYADGWLNTCHNALDRHVAAGRGEQAALVYDSPVTGVKRTYTYRELLDEVARTAGMLAGLGVGRGDTVVIYMPMVPEAVVAMLACARLGAVHSVVFGGFAAPELAVRIDHARPKVVLSASCGIEPSRLVEYKPLLDAALRQAEHRPGHCVILQRPQCRAELEPGRDLDWAEVLSTAEPTGCVSVRATDPLYVLYTSGTTGLPKGVVRDNGGHAVALHWSMSAVYGVAPGEVFWAASDVGWVVGHSYIVYAPLLAGCTTILYEGKPVGTPDPGAFWRVVAEHGVRVLFTAPTAIRAIKKEDPAGEWAAKPDLTGLRHLFLAGERLDPDTYHWATGLLGIPVIDHWWQTETGWPIAANCVGIEQLPLKPGSPTKPVPGYDVRILDSAGADCPPGTEGAVAIRLPLPPGCLPTLYKDDQRFTDSYLTRYPGHYLTGDGGYIDADGYLYVMGRIDDVINVAGHRLSTGAMEEVIAAHPDVAECAVIGVDDPIKGQLPMGFVVLKSGADRDPADLERELVTMIRDHIGPVAAFRRALVVTRLPKTRSGKILRATMRDIAAGRPYRTPSTIEDPTALQEITDAL
ncbi:propionyl-CoA synthetase [Nonomuraea endophytica]|uniref:propionyl-CoA synthetase n=1 Tax=Nonomuraea endophytica TaxID=714136 RepID=UPI0037CA5F7E